MEEGGIQRNGRSKGRQKIEMKLIENKDARHFCFSKRRAGIFKKTNELSIQTGAQVNGGRYNDPCARNAQQRLSQQYMELCALIEVEKRKKIALEEFMTNLTFSLNNKRSLDEMGMDELLEFEREILEFKKAQDTCLMETMEAT